MSAAAAANGATFFYYFNSTDTSCDSYVQRMDFALSPPCTVNLTSAGVPDATCSNTTDSVDSARYTKACIDVPKLPSVYLTSETLPLVVFNQYADSNTQCSSSSLTGGTQYAIDRCVSAHTETGFQTFEGRQVQSEYVSANMSNGQLIRSFFSDTKCYNYVGSVSFDGKQNACQSHMSATLINPLIYQRIVFYRDDACTLTNTIRYEVSNKVDCVPVSFCGTGNAFPQEKSCVNTPTLAADAAAVFKDKPYAMYDYFQDDNCQGFIRSSVVAGNVCRLITGNKSTNISALPDGSFVSTTYNGPDCTLGVNNTVKFTQNGACKDSVRLSAYNFQSVGSNSGANTGNGGASSESKTSIGPIIGGVVGGVVVLCAIGAFFYMRNKNAAKRQSSFNNAAPMPHSPADQSRFSQYEPTTPSPYVTSQGPFVPAPTQQYSAVGYNQNAALPLPPTAFAAGPVAAAHDARQHYYAPSAGSSSQPSTGPQDETTLFIVTKGAAEQSLNSQGALPLKDSLSNPANMGSFLDSSLTNTTSATAIQPIQIGKVTLPMNPATWTVAEVAMWVVENGGSSESARLVKEQDVDGRILIRAKVKELADALEIKTIGQRVRFEEGVEGLRALTVASGPVGAVGAEAPPAYN
ncbi:hypothetical protein HDU81_003328 [Chytriomyces hyalinus]|nr:hypothetical protein HDU81_003328 [Chytriomyces hyalinus]